MRDDQFLRKDESFGFQSTVTFKYMGGPQWDVKGHPGVTVRVHTGEVAKNASVLWTVRRRNRAVALPEARTLTLVPRNTRMHKHPSVIVRFLGYQGSPDLRTCTAVMDTTVESLS